MAAARPISKDNKAAAEPAGHSASAGDSQRLTPLRELQLLEAYRGGGPRGQQAITELVAAYQRRIYSICARMTRHRDDAADLTQDALIKMIEGLPSYNGQSKLSTWVIRVTMNCCLSHLRKRKLRTHESLDAASQHDGYGHAPSDTPLRPSAKTSFSGGSLAISGREPSPPQRIQQEQTRAMLGKALDCLDADMRAILVLRDLQELDYQQLAEVLEIPLGTVKSRLFRARSALRATIESLEGNPLGGIIERTKDGRIV